MFLFFFNSNSKSYSFPGFSICKDSEGKTTIIASLQGLDTVPTWGNSGSSAFPGTTVVNNNTSTIVSMYMTGENITDATQSHIFSTSLTPMSICDDHTFTKDAYFLVTAQNRNLSEFTVNGEKAVSNGYWCLIDRGLTKEDAIKTTEDEGPKE